MFAELDCLEQQIRVLQTRIEEVLTPTPEHQMLRSLPGVGFLLAAVIATEIGDIRRCKRAESLTGQAGVVSSVRAEARSATEGRERTSILTGKGPFSQRPMES